MKTRKELIEVALYLLYKEEISLEEAIRKASQETGLLLRDNIKIIRDFLRERELIMHNPRLTFIEQKEEVSASIVFVYDEIHDNFINDHITETCKSHIENKSLLTVLYM